jgi:peptide/nickel transport system substrate-binding protein
MAIEGIPQGFDPIYNNGIYEAQIYSQIYETLLRLDSDYRTIVPNLVQQWTIIPESNTYRFVLRPDVRFQDGHRLSVKDILYSLERYRQEKNDWLLKERILRTTAIDSLTFEIQLREAFTPFLYALCSPHIFVVQAFSSAEKEVQKKGTGPYFISARSDDGKVFLQQNVHYWQQRSNVEKICFIPFNNHEEAAYAIQDRKVDILYLISGFIVDRLKWTGKIQYVVNKPVNTLFFGLNNQQPPFHDRRVRQAILHALNLPKMVYNVNRSNALPASGPLPPVYADLQAPAQALPDLEQARLLMQEAGLKGNLEVRFFIAADSRYNFIELLKSQLLPLGIHLKIETFSNWDELMAAEISDRAQMFLDGYDSDIIGDPWYFLWTLFHSKSPQNSLKYFNSRVDSLINLAAVKYDLTERNQIYQKIVSIIIQETPAVFFSHVIPHFAVDSDKIKNISASPYQILDFNSIELAEQ